MQGVDGQVRCGCVELAADFVAQTARGFGGEGDHQDARGISSALADQMSNTGSQGRCFPQPGPAMIPSGPSPAVMTACWEGVKPSFTPPGLPE